ncbi:DUF4397 domain-containing protein [Pelobium manganitolerans]|uniref:DUF4397 domain-containing protein n=1 Tax=Pelobium manganitolerans TaxID=1842495 RepID=UPI003FA3B5B9
MKSLKQRGIAGFVILLVVFTMSSCLKNNDDYVAPNYSWLSVTNASPNVEKFDFVIDNELVNNEYFSFGDRLSYQALYSGTRRIGIFKDGTTDSLRTGTLVAQPNKIYSLYVVGEAPNTQFLVTTDSIKEPTAGKARVRFMNLSINAPALKLNYGVDSTLFTNVAYKGYTDFVEIPGGKKYNFSVATEAGGGNSASQNAIMIESNKNYTVWAKGYYNGSTTDSLKLGLKIQENR